MNGVSKGSFEIDWNGNIIEDVTEVAFTYNVSDQDYQTLQGKTRTIDGPVKVTAGIKLLKTDIEALAAVLPQYFVPDGQVLSTGETVVNSHGAIDVIDNCSDAPISADLLITSCGAPGQVMRVTNCRTRIDSIDIDPNVRTVTVLFIGEAPDNQALLQFFAQGGLNPAS